MSAFPLGLDECCLEKDGFSTKGTAVIVAGGETGEVYALILNLFGLGHANIVSMGGLDR